MKTSHFLTFVGGAIAGAAIALLFAPERGEDTRRRIRDYIDTEADKVRSGIKERICDSRKGREPSDI